jgi:hypothetical protein
VSVAGLHSAPCCSRCLLRTPVLPCGALRARARAWQGIVFLNNFIVGRYWNPKGPQMTLYIAAPLLVTGANHIVLLEMDTVVDPGAAAVTFVDAPDFTGPQCELEAATTAPAAGAVVAMFPCQSPAAPAQLWQTSAATAADGSTGMYVHPSSGGGMFDATLCLALGPRRDPSTGQPGTQLLPCSTSGADLVFSQGAGGTLVSAASGLCLDITSHLTTPCAGVEGYGCNGGANQQWTLPPAAGGAVTSAQDGHCLSVAQPAA